MNHGGKDRDVTLCRRLLETLREYWRWENAPSARHKRQRWLSAREQEVLPTTDFHVAFSVPHELNVLALENPRCFYHLRFAAASATLLRVVRGATEAQIASPDVLRTGHEAHFAQVANQFLKYLRDPKTMPKWETANMLAKYYVTTEGVAMAQRGKGQ